MSVNYPRWVLTNGQIIVDLSALGHITTLRDTWQQQEPGHFSVDLLIQSTNPRIVRNRYHAIERLVQEAAVQSNRGRTHGRVSLIEQQWGTAPAEWDIQAAVLTRGTQRPTYVTASLELFCLPQARLAPISFPTTPTLVNGVSSMIRYPAVPGDLPAPLRLTIVDQSDPDQFVINRLRIARLGRLNMPDGSASMIFPMQPSGVGSYLAEPDSLTGNVVTAQTSADWQTIAQAVRPDLDGYTEGIFEARVRFRDAIESLATPRNVTAVLSPGISRVQDNALADNGLVAGCRWLKATAPGNELIMVVTTRGLVSYAVSGGWTLVQSSSDTTDGQAKVAIYHRPNAASRSGVEQVTFSVATDWTLHLMEYSYIAATSPVDKLGTETGTHTVMLVNSSGSTVQAYELGIAALAYDEMKSLIGLNSGWDVVSRRQAPNAADGYAHTAIVSERQFQTIGSVSASFTAVGDGLQIGAAGVLATFKALSTGQPALASGTYHYRVVAVGTSGELSLPSDEAQLTFDGTYGVAELNWPAVAGADHYRVYWYTGTLGVDGAWAYFTANGPSFIMTTATGATAASLPDTTTPPVNLRLALTTGDGQILDPQEPFSTTHRLANGTFETASGGVILLPPHAGRESALVSDWRVMLQIQHPNAVSPLDVDCLLLSPLDEAILVASYTDSDGGTLTLTQPVTWVIEQNRLGQVSCALLDSSTGEHLGQATCFGSCTLTPGDNLLLVWAEGQGGVSSVTAARFSVAATVIPMVASPLGDLL